MRSKAWIVLAVVVVTNALFLPVANAYVDPGSGSFVFQALIGGLLAASVAIKVSWKRITGFVSRRGRDDDDAPEP